jgi:hypothetical protein
LESVLFRTLFLSCRVPDKFRVAITDNHKLAL